MYQINKNIASFIFQNRKNLYNTKDVNNSLCEIVLIFLLFGCLGRQANIQLSVTDKKFKQNFKNNANRGTKEK